MLLQLQKIQEDGGWYEAICNRKLSPSSMDEDDGQTTIKPDEEKEKEEAQNKIEKNSCAWMTRLDQNKFEFHNDTGLRVYLCVFMIYFANHIDVY